VSLAGRSLRWGGGGPDRWSYARSTWVFLRLLGVAYLSAFWSLGIQVQGLIGEHGILPASELMAAARRHAGPQGPAFANILALPTLCWIDASDATLVSLCAVGAVLSLVLIAGFAGALVLPSLWLLYLSLSTVSGEFLAFQWDALLLETGLIAVVVAPWTLVHRPSGGDPPPLARWLLWWLLFRLMFAAGVVKLASGDPLWRGLTALAVHYETQPLPTPIGWYAHHLPASLHTVVTAAALGIELVVPWFILGPRRLRHVACAMVVALQLAIALTGNYTFFNLLTIGLALVLLDDAAWPRWMWGRRGGTVASAPRQDRNWAPHLLVAAVLTIVTVPLTIGMLAAQAGVTLPWHSALRPLRRALAPLHAINTYGLFAVMTPRRPEIIVEGSDDSKTWKAYEFRYKPGDVRRAPPWVAPHQPRLDWQMWFAALDSFDQSPWFERFCYRLLEGAAPVVDLLAVNPFPDAPPRFVRARLFQYHIAPLERHRAEGVWWTREKSGPYSPVLSRESRRAP
jgi:hypothetical protein